MNCKSCGKGLKKVCNKFKKYDEFRCKYDIIVPGDAEDNIMEDIIEDFYFSIEEEEYEEKKEKKRRKKRTYLVED